MSNRFAVVAFGAVAIVAITATLMIPPSDPQPPDKAAPSVAPAPAPGSTDPAVAPRLEASPEAPAPTSAPPPDEPGPIQDEPDKVFSLDATGRVNVDEQTRLNIEAFYARYGGDGLENAKEEIRRSLPPEAAAEAIDLVEKFGNYQTAARQTYPPGVAPPTEDHAIAELDGLHALRVAHFGEGVANAFYGREEKATRALLELMRIEKDQSLTPQEKAERADALRASMPELAALEQMNN